MNFILLTHLLDEIISPKESKNTILNNREKRLLFINSLTSIRLKSITGSIINKRRVAELKP